MLACLLFYPSGESPWPLFSRPCPCGASPFCHPSPSGESPWPLFSRPCPCGATLFSHLFPCGVTLFFSSLSLRGDSLGDFSRRGDSFGLDSFLSSGASFEDF